MFAPSLLEPIKTWASENKAKICAGVDIGGSGFRVRLSNLNNRDQFLDVPHVRAQSTKDLVESLTNLQNGLNEIVPNYECCGAALAVAGPIKNGTVVLTNWPGDAECRTLSLDHLPQKLFTKGKTVLLNDLEAGAYGVIAASDLNILEDHFEQLWKNVAPKGPIFSQTRTAVMALGSGVGAALIARIPFVKNPLVLPLELGHAQIPTVCQNDPGATEEHELIQHVSEHYYNGTQTPEYEDIASGRGIQLCYQFFLKRDTGELKPVEQINAGDVAAKAKNGDKTAKNALFWCYKSS